MLSAKVFLVLMMALPVALCGCGERPSRIGQKAPAVRILAFTSKTCGPCRRDKPELEEISRRVQVVYIDVDRNPATANQFGVISLPTYVVQANGKNQLVTNSLQHLRRSLGL